jgi:hypothetical protein
MGNLVYPTLPGLDFGVKRSPMAPPVAIRTTPSLREYRGRDTSFVRYSYELSYAFLRSAASYAELQNLVGFYNLVGGPFDTFLFTDPDDNAATNTQFALGDGTTRVFQLVRAYGGFSEAVYDIQGATLQIFKNGLVSYGYDRTNLVGMSQDITNAYWSKLASTATGNTTTAPDGTTTADTFAEDTTASTGHYITRSISFTSGTSYTFSAYFKATGSGSTRWVQLLFPSGPFSGNIAAVLDMSTGAVSAPTGVTASAVSVGSGWWRFSATATAVSTASSGVQMRLANSYTNLAVSYTGDGVSGAFIWGIQLETGTVATTYIPNTTTSALTAPAEWALGTGGVVTFTAAATPGASVPLTWTGNYYRRCRFLDGQLDPSKFMNNLWELRKVAFISAQS